MVKMVDEKRVSADAKAFAYPLFLKLRGVNLLQTDSAFNKTKLETKHCGEESASNILTAFSKLQRGLSTLILVLLYSFLGVIAG